MISTFITKWMIDTYGPTKGCAGCQFIVGNTRGRGAHNDHCRKKVHRIIYGNR